jgi:hypothetical protein
MAGFFFEIVDNVPAIKASDKFPKYKSSEDHFQKSVARYLDLVGSFWFHCPNGGSRHGLEAAKLKQMGVKSGIPDCLILDSRHGYAGLAIELKVGYNKPSEHQLAVLDKLVERNWMVVVSWSLEEVVAAVDWYYGIGKLQP